MRDEVEEDDGMEGVRSSFFLHDAWTMESGGSLSQGILEESRWTESNLNTGKEQARWTLGVNALRRQLL